MLLHCSKVVRGDENEYTVEEFTSARSTVNPHQQERIQSLWTQMQMDESPVVI